MPRASTCPITPGQPSRRDSRPAAASKSVSEPSAPAIANGSVAILENSTPLAASANPSPLSIGWGVDDYFALLAGSLAPSE